MIYTDHALQQSSTKDEGLIQAVADNVDANISSQNGLQSTHALAILMTLVEHGHEETDNKIRNEG